jgi:hypothetical protein
MPASFPGTFLFVCIPEANICALLSQEASAWSTYEKDEIIFDRNRNDARSPSSCTEAAVFTKENETVKLR